MKKIIHLLAASSVLTLMACSEDSNVTQNPVNPADQQTTASRISFQPAAGVLPVPSDLLFSGTVDGTLEMPDEVEGRDAGGADYSSPTVVMGALDGWSTTMPIQFTVDMAESSTINAATLAGNIRIFETYTSNGTTCNGNPTAIPVGLPCAPTGTELAFGTDFVTQAADSSITVLPLKPLTPSTTFVIAVLSGVEDSRGELLGASATYQSLKDTSEDLSGNPSLASLQGAISIYEGMVQAGTGGAVNSDDIIYSMAMTTQSIGNDLTAIKSVLATIAPAVSVSPTGNTVRDVLTPLIGDPGVAFDSVNYYAGTVTLPYYSAVPTVNNPLAPTTDPWRALCDNGVLLAAGATGTPGPNDATCQSFGLNDFGLDSERHITQYNPVPEIRSMEVLDVQMTVPVGGCGGPCNVVILQHGLTRQKEDMLLMTAALSAANFATVAIDHPLHGSRGFDLGGDPGDEINATTVSVTHYLNLASLLVARDNFKQSIADTLGLRLALESFTSTDSVTVNTANVHLTGLSLGAITGIGSVAVANASVNTSFNFKSVSLHSPGGGIAPTAIESPTFAPLVQSGVLLAAGTALSAEFNAFLASPDASCVSVVSDQEAYASCEFNVFVAQLTANSETDKLAELAAIVSAFSLPLQTVADSFDPVNYAASLGMPAVATPVHMTEIIGDGTPSNLPDQVLPNTTTLPFGGTERLATFIGLSGLGEGGTATSAIVRFTSGDHGSVVDPSANAAVTTEMQMETAGFFAAGTVTVSGGTSGIVATP